MNAMDNMSQSKSIEEKLSELIPSAISECSLGKMDAIIDDLSSENMPEPVASVHGDRQNESSVTWSDVRQWKVAAVFALLCICSMVVASQFNIIKVSFLPAVSASAGKSEPLDIRPSQPRIIKAVVSSATVQPENDQSISQRQSFESVAMQEQGFARVSECLSIRDESGTATLEYREGQPWLRVESVKGVQIYNNYINEEQLDLVPSIWRDRVAVLQDSLEESSRLRKSYRARYIPKSKHGFVDSEK